MSHFIVIGSIIMDIVVQTPRIPRSGENLHARQLIPLTGGKGANAAVALTRLGARARLITNVGYDAFGQEALATLARERVDTSAVGQTHDAGTGAAVLLVEPDGETTFVVVPGANLSLTPEQVEARWAQEASRARALLFNFEVSEAALARAVELARAAAVPIFVDAGPARPYSAALWQHAAVLSPNQSETEALVGYSIASDEAAQQAASELLARGPQAVVLKLGARGALLATATQMQFFPAFDIQAADTAGAGDAFTAGLMWARTSGWAWNKALRWANACGALAASHLGAMPAMPTRAQVERFLTTSSGTNTRSDP